MQILWIKLSFSKLSDSTTHVFSGLLEYPSPDIIKQPILSVNLKYSEKCQGSSLFSTACSLHSSNSMIFRLVVKVHFEMFFLRNQYILECSMEYSRFKEREGGRGGVTYLTGPRVSLNTHPPFSCLFAPNA